MRVVELRRVIHHEQAARLQIDAANYIDLNGKAGLSAPYPYQAFGQVSLPKLDNFNQFLKAFKQPEGLAGTLQATVSGHGDVDPVGSMVELKVYDDLFHEIYLEPERDQVIADVVAYLDRRFPRVIV